MPDPMVTAGSSNRQRLADFGTVAQALDYAARGDGAMSFYSGRGERVDQLSYRDLRDQAGMLARRLLRAGLNRGDRLALIAETDADFVRVFFACQYAGVVPVPLPLPATFGGRDEYIGQLRRLMVSCGAAAAMAPASMTEHLAEAAASLPMRFVGGPDVLQGVPDGGIDLPPIEEEDLCYLQFSSGSTRFPLGVAVTQRALMSNVRGITRDGVRLTPADRAVSWLPLYHDMGLVGFLLTPLLSQMSVDYMTTRDFARRPFLWLQILSRNGGTLSYSPSFGYELCVRRAETVPINGIDLRRWRVAGIGGDMIRAQALADFDRVFAPTGFRRKAFVPSYGLAETTLAVSFAPLDTGPQVDRVDLDRLSEERMAVPTGDSAGAPAAGPADRPDRRDRDFVLCGPPLPEHEAEVRDEDGHALPDRRVGRIFVRGPSVMKGYFGNEAETARLLSPDGWLDTGDLGYRLDGSIVVTGRAKDLIIINGRNIWPQDLEWTAEQVPGLRSGDAAAFSIDDEHGVERVVLLVQCRLSDPAARRDLAQAVAGAVLAVQGVDGTVALVPPHGLPRTSSGKLSRTRAKQNYVQGVYDEPSSAGRTPAPQRAAGSSA